MSQTRLLGIVVALVVLAAALWGSGLLFGGGTVAPPTPIDAPANATPATAPAPAEAKATAADAPSVAKAEADAAAARVAVAPGTGTALTGRVVDDKGQPVAGAEVATMPDFGFGGGDLEDLGEGMDMERMAQRWREREQQRVAVTTDSKGAFRIVPTGTERGLNVTVKARGFEVLHREEQRPERGDADLGELALQRGAIVSGRVVDHQSRPVAGARVSRPFGGTEFLGDFDPGFEGAEAMALSENMMGSAGAVTDAEGRFEIASMPAGEFTLQARHAEFPTARTDKLQLAAGATRSDLLIAFGAAATIRGTLANVPAGKKDIRVLARVPRAPRGGEAQEGLAAMFGGDVGGAMDDFGMQFGERSCKPQADGTFTLQGLKAGQTYRVWAVQGGMGFGLGAACSQRVEVAAGSSGIELRYDLGITVSLQVVDAKTGAPIEDLFVRDRLVGGSRGLGDFMQFMPGNRRSQHYPEGHVAVANLRPKKDQKLTLTLDALGHGQWQQKDIALPGNGNLDLGTVRLEPVPVLRVQVLDQKSGRPIAGARVHLREEREPKASAEPASGEAAAAEAQVAFDAALEGGAADGLGGGPTQSARTDASGWCSLNASKRSATLAASERNHAPLRTDAFEPAAAGDAERTLRMVRGGTVEVTVLDAGGAPQKSVRVEHRGGGGADFADLADAMPFGNRGETDSNGVARFEHLPPGEHSFRLGGRGGAAGAVNFAIENLQDRGDAGYSTVQVADEATATLELRADATARVHGIVRENGVPVDGARVSLLPGAGDAASDAGAAIADQFEGMLQGGLARDAGLARTGADGSYQLNNAKTGEHRLRVRVKGRAMPTVVRVTLAAGDNLVDVDLDTTALRGVVVDSAGKPVAKAKVRVQRAPKEKAAEADAAAAFGVEVAMEAFGQAGGGAGEVTTGDDGTFELRGVECEVPLVVRARAKGFVDAVSAPVEVARGATKAGIELKLGSGGTVKVKVTEARPFTMVQARFVGDEKDVKPVMKMMQGSSCTLDGLRPGRWEISLQASPFDRGAKVEPRTVEVAAGAEVTVELQ